MLKKIHNLRLRMTLSHGPIPFRMPLGAKTAFT